jgi:hypothetical protein
MKIFIGVLALIISLAPLAAAESSTPSKEEIAKELANPNTVLTSLKLQTMKPYPTKANWRDKRIVNDDGSVDLYFSQGAGRQGAELDPNCSRQGLILPLASL